MDSGVTLVKTSVLKNQGTMQYAYDLWVSFTLMVANILSIGGANRPYLREVRLQ
jgi:hypothetical protein